MQEECPLSEPVRTRIEERALALWQRAKAAGLAFHDRYGRILRPVVRWVIPILLLVLVGFALTHVGWEKIILARPTSLLFYGVLAIPFFIQPVADWLIYYNLLGGGLPLTIFLRKRYMNTIMLDYSGEVFFFFWARKKLAVEDKFLAHAVKDSNVLSAAAGLVVLWLMLLILVLDGIVRLPALRLGVWGLVALGSVPLLLGLALFFANKRLTVLSRGDILATFAIHLTRVVAALGFEFYIWWLSGALSSVSDCLKFVALHLVVTRLPLVPNKDLVFVGVGLAAVGVMDVSAPKVAAVLVLLSAASLVEGFLIVGLPWLVQQTPFWRRLTGAASVPAP